MAQQKTVFRDLMPKDSEAVSQIIADLAKHIDPNIKPLTNANTIDYYGPDGLSLFDGIVAEQEGKIIGLCLFSIRFSGWRGAPGVFINDLYVDKTVRTSGLGKKLLHKTAEKGFLKGCKFLQLDVDIKNKNAINFYSHIGLSIHKNDIQMFMEKENFLNFTSSS